MATYRSRTTEVEAFIFGRVEPPDWFRDAIYDGRVAIKTQHSGLCTNPEDVTTVRHFLTGDYILKTADGRIYPCDPEIFESIYEKVEDNES